MNALLHEVGLGGYRLDAYTILTRFDTRDHDQEILAQEWLVVAAQRAFDRIDAL